MRFGGHSEGMAIRPALRPGAPVLRRDSNHLQIGTSPGIVIRDRPGLMHLLLHLEEVGTTHIPADLLQELTALGVLVDSTLWGSPPDDELRAHTLTGSVEQAAARAHTSVAVHSDAGTNRVAASVVQLLNDSGVTVLNDVDPELLVVITTAEPSRHLFVDAVRDGLDHLIVRCDENRVLIGPLVVPGRTPCLSCYDLNRSQWDRSWPALVRQFGSPSVHVNLPAITHLTEHAAAGEIAGMVLEHLDGGPSARGLVLSVGPHQRERESWPLKFHPRCSCSLLPLESSAST